MDIRTADLCDQFSDELDICEPLFGDFGGQLQFGGQIATLKCFEDNSLVRELTAEAGNGRVLVIDAGGSMRRAVVGDMLAKKAVDNGWAGIVVYGCIRNCRNGGARSSRIRCRRRRSRTSGARPRYPRSSTCARPARSSPMAAP